MCVKFPLSCTVEHDEITGAHNQSDACQLQGGAGPGEFDACHWKDILL